MNDTFPGNPISAAVDAIVTRAALEFILSVYPKKLTFRDIVNELTGCPSDIRREVDRVRRAVDDLLDVDLVYRDGDLLVPSAQAIIFAWIVELDFSDYEPRNSSAAL